MADMNTPSGWDDEDTYWRTNYRSRPYSLVGQPRVPIITSRATGMATKRRIGFKKIEAGTTSKPTCRGTGIPTNTAVVRPGNR